MNLFHFSGLVAAILGLAGCGTSPAVEPRALAVEQLAQPLVQKDPSDEMRLDFAHFPVIFDARHAFLSLYDISGEEDALVMRLHATSVELKRRNRQPYYEFRENVGPCLKMLPFVDTAIRETFMPDWTGRAPLSLAEDAALFERRGWEEVPVLAGSREQVLGKFAQMVALANQINDNSIKYSFRGTPNPNSNSALFAIMKAAGMERELRQASEGWWFPGAEMAIPLDPVALPNQAAAAEAFRAELDRLQIDIQQAEMSEPCASF